MMNLIGNIIGWGKKITGGSIMYGLRFDGTNDSIQLNTNKTVTGSYELEWVTPSFEDAFFYPLSGVGVQEFVALSITATYIRNNGGLVTFSVPITPGTVGMVKKNGSNFELYQNGILVDTKPIKGNISTSFTVKYGGRYSNGFTEGVIKELRIKGDSSEFTFPINEGTGSVTRSTEDPSGVYFNITGATWIPL